MVKVNHNLKGGEKLIIQLLVLAAIIAFFLSITAMFVRQAVRDRNLPRMRQPRDWYK
jgi:hypothetical protein